MRSRKAAHPITYIILLLVILPLVFVGCGGPSRDTSSTAKALLGSWKPVNPQGARIFFSPDTATYLPASGGESLSVPYEIIEESEAESWVDLRYLALGSGEPKEAFRIQFSKDRKRFYLYPANAPEFLEYIYMDNRQGP